MITILISPEQYSFYDSDIPGIKCDPDQTHWFNKWDDLIFKLKDIKNSKQLGMKFRLISNITNVPEWIQLPENVYANGIDPVKMSEVLPLFDSVLIFGGTKDESNDRT